MRQPTVLLVFGALLAGGMVVCPAASAQSVDTDAIDS